MKLRDVAKGTWAVRTVPLRLANAGAAQPGQPPSEASATVKVGVRVLLGAETATVYEKAQEFAKERGVLEWKDTHPICSLYEMAFTILFSVCDVDQESGLPVAGANGKPDQFFDSVDQILDDPLIGTDNIVYLHEQWVRWQDECSFRNKKISVEEAMGAILVDMEAPDSPDSPLLSMGPASLVSCLRIMGKVFLTSPTGKSLSGQPDDSSTSRISRSLLESGLDPTS